MKLLRESPVEFLEPLRRPPEKVFVTEIDCGKDTFVLAGNESGLIRGGMNIPLPYFIGNLESEWGIELLLDEAPLKDAAGRIAAFFNGSPEPIKAVIQPVGLTPFTVDVHRIIACIPWGGLLTYGDIAVMLGKPGAARAVGSACGRNQILIVVPCHRVVGANGLGGFGASGGLKLKKRLLRHENALGKVTGSRSQV